MPLVSKAFGDIITFTRASTATYFDATGTLQSAAIDAPRFDYDPSTLAAQGFLVEEARTNSIRNNTMQGAVAGTPGTLPTNWTGSGSPLNGLTRQVVGTGTESGITYVDIRYSGTATATSFHSINEETIGAIAASSGQSWTHTAYISVVAGSTANINAFDIGINEYSSVPAFLAGSSTTVVLSSGALSSKRYTCTRTLTNASTVSVHPFLAFTYNNGAAIDITLRIGLPQLELGAFATSVIPTTTTALTRSADVASVNTLSPWFNTTASTLYTEFSSPVPTTVTASAVVAGYDDGTANNRFSNFYTSNTGAVAANQTTGGAANFTISAATGLTLSNIQKQATRFQAGSYASSVNGAAVVTDPFASAPPTVNTLRFGLRPSGTQANMWLRRVTVYPRGLSNAELQALTV